MSAGDYAKRVLESYDQSGLSFDRMREQIWEILNIVKKSSESRNDVLAALDSHPRKTVRDFADDCRKTLRLMDAQITDIDELRKTSPLKPGTRVLMGGGYLDTPQWLGGQEVMRGTFVDFLPAGEAKLPVALVELDEEIEIRHWKGRYAVLQLHFIANWTDSEIVYVYVVDSPPAAAAALIASEDWIESHAKYVIETAGTNS